MKRKWMKLKLNLLPLVIQEVEKVTEEYLNMLNEMAFAESDLFNEYLEFREDVSNRIDEIDAFYEQNFGHPLIVHFEKARIRLKKLLMYNPEIFELASNKNEMRSLYITNKIKNAEISQKNYDGNNLNGKTLYENNMKNINNKNINFESFNDMNENQNFETYENNEIYVKKNNNNIKKNIMDNQNSQDNQYINRNLNFYRNENDFDERSSSNKMVNPQTTKNNYMDNTPKNNSNVANNNYNKSPISKNSKQETNEKKSKNSQYRVLSAQKIDNSKLKKNIEYQLDDFLYFNNKGLMVTPKITSDKSSVPKTNGPKFVNKK